MISLKSAITKKILNYFFVNPEEELYVNEISRKLAADKRNLIKKLKELENEGILTSKAQGNLKLYSINQNYPLYDEYKNIVLKTLGLERKLREIIRQTENITEAHLYGSYAKDKLAAHSDIDLLVVGTHSIIKLQQKINKLQREINREINIINMDPKEYNKRKKTKDPFILNILKGKHIKLL